ncbi:MAG: anaerobic ribonucleoside-triphosphate reductase [Candidatus Brocadiales bacterium]
MSAIETIRKRDGRTVPFDTKKIADAIFKAAHAVGGNDRKMAEELAELVSHLLKKKFNENVPGIEDIQDLVEDVLINTGHAKTAKVYIRYRDRRVLHRGKLKVRKKTSKGRDTTDAALMVETDIHDETSPWDKNKIALALEKEAGIPINEAIDIAGVVEKRVFNSGIHRISTGLLRELVDNELFERGYNTQLKKQATIGMPKYDLDQLIFSKVNENSNIATNNPEAINLSIAENTLKQYALQEVYSEDVAGKHLSGAVHIHDLGYPTRVYCSSHSLEYLKKYGLHLDNLDTVSAPARHARTLTGHLNTYLASMQAYYAGALGIGYINILYAPYMDGMNKEQLRQEAQHLIYSCSQSAFSRGGQTLFLDFNIHTGVPNYMKGIPAIGAGGKYTGKTYGDYEETAREFTMAMLDVWRAGDCHGHIFAFPKCDLHINQDTLDDPEQYKILEYACQMASENGVPYFVFDRDEVTLSACCRLRTTIEDDYMITNPESMRFCGFQNVTVNLPQAAYRAGGKGNWEALYNEIGDTIQTCIDAHLQKKAFIARLMSGPEMPLWQIGKPAKDGRPYVDLEKSTYIVGILGLNECLQHMMDMELHEGEEPLRQGLRVIAFMYQKVKEAGKKYGLKFSLEESPAESASRRLAKIDVKKYPQARALVKGDIEGDEYYYTNSVHLRPDAPIDMLTRIVVQSKFHTMIESGAIIHAFCGEERPPATSIMNLVKKTFKNTQAAQVTISPEFTVCTVCNRVSPRLTDCCDHCGAYNVSGINRLDDYEDRLNNWDTSKVKALAERFKDASLAELI